jgi:3-methyladenine DNA glycosylase Tag
MKDQHAPPQYDARTPDDYLEHLSKSVFQAGISWRVVNAKWPDLKAAMHGFNARRVAKLSERDIDALAKDERMIRSRPKIAAVVHNARELVAIDEQDGGIRKHLRSFPSYDALEADLIKRFKFVGPSGTYHFLWSVKHPVPDWREWSKARGMSWGQDGAKGARSHGGNGTTRRGTARRGAAPGRTPRRVTPARRSRSS